MPYTSVLLFVAFIPLLIAIEEVIRGNHKNKGRKIFTLAFLTGLIWNTASIYWVYNAMNAYLDTATSFLISLIPFSLGPLLMAFAFSPVLSNAQEQPYFIKRNGARVFLGCLRVPASKLGPLVSLDDTRKRVCQLPSVDTVV